ncbi:LysR family transcriptional regulator [Paraburkholderia caribensis]|uniref:LysR family transcriptional regulator n=1 Tax=Paraburkholderia caribensis TaxID=75105 RepID=UPI001CB26FF2|nr:LysR family transcriptional regulator [Paraburkholderia caribensis]CAG9219672.1 LysR family transcriptional regulator [Paraburkholderia caribensis]
MFDLYHGSAVRYFIEVARAGSLSAASERMHIAVSAISRQIAKLEGDLGVPLFERLPRGMALSEAGKKLMAFAVRNRLEAEILARDIQGLDELQSGNIRLAISEGFSNGIVPNCVAEFLAQYPGMRIDVYAGSPRAVAQRVKDGDADVGISYAISPLEGVRSDKANLASVSVLVRATDPLAQRTKVSLRDIASRKVALPNEGTTLRDLLDAGAAQAGVVFERIVIESNTFSLLYAVARRTDAVFFAARQSLTHRFEADGFVPVQVDPKEVRARTIEVQTMAGRRLSTAIATFKQHLIDALSED